MNQGIVLLIGFMAFIFIYEKEGFEVQIKDELLPMALVFLVSFFVPYPLYLGIIAVLILSAVLDYEKGVISNAASFTVFFYGCYIAFSYGRIFTAVGFAFLTLLFFLIFSLISDGIGGGDIKLLAALTPGFPLLYSMYFLISALLFGILTFPLLKRKVGRFPLGPAILLGYTLIFLIFF